AIERRRGRSLDDLDVLDLVRIDVVETPHHIAARSAVRIAGGSDADRALHTHTVDVHNGVGGERDAAAPPDLDTGTGTRRAGTGVDHDPRGPGVEELRDIGDDTGFHHLGGIDGSDRVPDRASLLPTSRARDDDLIEVERYRHEPDRDRSLSRRHRFGLRLE